MTKSTFSDARIKAALGTIRNLYWHIRALRSYDQSKRRQLYRLVAKQKTYLIGAGFDPEELRLYCRQFSRCYKKAAAGRYEAYLQQKSE